MFNTLSDCFRGFVANRNLGSLACPPWAWRRFESKRRVVSASFYWKFVYGMAGLGFLLFTAFFSGGGEGNSGEKNSPPMSWYWQWLVADSVSWETTPVRDPDADLGLADYSTAESDLQFSWGTDKSCRSIRKWMGSGARSYLILGSISGVMAILLGLIWSALSEWIKRPQLPLPHRPRRWHTAAAGAGAALFKVTDYTPKLILLLFIFGGLRGFSESSFTIAMGLFLAFGPANLFRDRLRTFLGSEQYLYAMELGLPSSRIFLSHFLVRQVAPLLKIQMPFLVSQFIMYDATLHFLKFTTGAEGSWGQLILDNRITFAKLPEQLVDLGRTWGYTIPIVSVTFVVSSLYILGDALRDGRYQENV